MSISDTTVKRIVDAGERADDMVRNTARTVQEMDPTPFGRALGWFSIGLGLAEALAPKTMAKAIGAEGYEGVVCAFGLREIATGIGILSGERPAAGWLWARVGGDALDLAFLGMAAACNRDNGGRVAIAAAAGRRRRDGRPALRTAASRGRGFSTRREEGLTEPVLV